MNNASSTSTINNIEQPDSVLRFHSVSNYQTFDKDRFGNFKAWYLQHIYQRVIARCPKAIEVAAYHMTTTTKGFGHNRYRSKFARQLKHCQLSEQQRQDILSTILTRLEQGDIDEQFVEQLRFAKWLDSERSIEVANKILQDVNQPNYVICYAKKLLNFGASSIPKNF